MTRCTYCLLEKAADAFRDAGDHVLPASIGGACIDDKVCDDCNKVANAQADTWLPRDPLVQLLRNAYGVRSRQGRPEPCRFSVTAPCGGVVQVTIGVSGVKYEAKLSARARERAGVSDPPTPEELARMTADGLGLEGEPSRDALALACAAREFAARPTPPAVWSRFMSKLALACGREAYGESWLDSRQADILSRDLLGEGPPRFAQRTHYPPVNEAWPYDPPGHRLWIDMYEDTAILWIVLFGQVIGAVPVADDAPPKGSYSAWSLDPVTHAFARSSYPAILLGTAAAKLTRAGFNVLMMLEPEPMLYVADGPDGPASIPLETFRAESPQHALELLATRRSSG